MSRFEAWAMFVSGLLVAGTGAVYGWMRYLATSPDPFAVVNHPWQPHLLHLHVVTAPLLVFAVGLVWREHVWKHFRNGVRGRRRSGLSMMLTLVPMIVSGYLIQTAVEPAWRTAWVVVHVAASVLWTAGFGAHLLVPVLVRRRRRRAARAELADSAGQPAINPS